MGNSLKMCEVITVSPLGKTWILDLDGTLVKHNGYKLDGHDTLLPGTKKFLSNIGPDDMVIIVTSRKENIKEKTIAFLRDNHIRYDHIIWEAPYGERIVVNDKKPSDLKMAFSVNTERNIAPQVNFEINTAL